jgi:chitodextrinase
MRALAAGILLAIALAGCGGTISKSAASPTARTFSPCVVSATPSYPPRSPSPPPFGGSALVSQGQTVDQPFTLFPSLLEVAVQMGWQTGDIQASLISPSGRVVDRTTDAPDVLHPGTINSLTLVVKHPEAGKWTLRLYGALVPSSGEQVGFGVIQIPLSDFGPVTYVGLSVDRGVAPLAIEFTAGHSAYQGATITSYRWDFGDCSPADSAPNPTHVFTAAGNYAVSVTITDSNGQTDTADHEILVTAYNHTPTASFLWGIVDPKKPLVIGMNETAKDIDGQITSYKWKFGDGTTGSDRLVYHTYKKAGTYPVTLTVTDDGGLTGSTCQLVTTGHVFKPSEPPVQCVGG